jgi:excisionase family DNA binding protein
MTTGTIDKLLYTPNEAAQALGISRSTLYVLLSSGAVPSVRIGTCRRIPAAGLHRFVAALGPRTPSGETRPGPAHGARQQRLWK